MVTDQDLKNTQILSMERIKKFLHDKVIKNIVDDMRKKGVSLSMPVVNDLKSSDKDFHFKTLRKISYYINNYK